MRLGHLIAVSAIALLFTLSLAQARLVHIQYGDIDGGVYNDAASVDHVYVDGNWVISLVNNAWPGPFSDFDQSRVDHNVACTFLLPLQPDETVTAATIT